jgi:AcrR family transcriptional regulator
MNSGESRRYHSPLREQQAELTRERILAAVDGVMTEEGLDKFSVAAVARRAEIQERTIYRHFPTREELLIAFWNWKSKQIGAVEPPRTPDEVVAALPDTFAALDRAEGLARALVLSPQGREVRLLNNKPRVAGIEQAVEQAAAGLDARTKRQAVAVLRLIDSMDAWLNLKEFAGLNGREAGQAAAWLAEMVFEELRRTARKRNRAA